MMPALPGPSAILNFAAQSGIPIRAAPNIMSKAFTRESDDDADDRPPARPIAALPPGAKNYLTASGARRLQDELDQLIQVERPRLVAQGNEPDNRRTVQLCDQRIAQLQGTLASAEIVEPPLPPHDQVRFGATVTVREPDGELASYRIVGVNEVDFEQGSVSWLSPIARALLNARIGQRVHFRIPAGQQELEIVNITYI